MPSDQREDIELTDLETGLSSLPVGTNVPALLSGQVWHPKVTPYRLLSVLLPACLGTVKVAALQQGAKNEPITLEWISGVVVFIVLFNTGTYERKPIHHIPVFLAWLFKYDCMDAIWWLRFKISRGAPLRPRYISDEVQVEEHGTIDIVTSYRLLVCATVVTIGMLKAALTYGGVSTGATWIEWILGVVISSLLYIIGLYESNTIGLWSSLFGTNRAYIVRNGLTGTSKFLFILTSLAVMFMWLFFERPYASPSGHTNTELPAVLRAYNMTTTIFSAAPAVGCLAVGAFMFYWSLVWVFADLGDRIRVPRRIRVFFLWAASFASFAYIPPMQTASYRYIPPSLLAPSWGALRLLTYTLRHPLSFVLASILIILAFSFSAGQMYRVATGDLPLMDKNGVARGPAWKVVMYISLVAVGIILIVPAGVVVVWSSREMLRWGRQKYMATCASRLRQARVKVRGQVQKIKRRAHGAAVYTVLGLSGLSDVDAVHYAFVELVSTLRGTPVPSYCLQYDDTD